MVREENHSVHIRAKGSIILGKLNREVSANFWESGIQLAFEWPACVSYNVDLQPPVNRVTVSRFLFRRWEEQSLLSPCAQGGLVGLGLLKLCCWIFSSFLLITWLSSHSCAPPPAQHMLNAESSKFWKVKEQVVLVTLFPALLNQELHTACGGEKKRMLLKNFFCVAASSPPPPFLPPPHPQSICEAWIRIQAICLQTPQP